MANVLKIKRSATSPAAAPTALARGELAYQEVSQILYIGAGTETGGEAANEPVVAGPLNVMPAPTANVDLNSKRIVNLAAPVAANDAARKTDVDAAIQGLDVRASVRAATTANITIATALNNGDAIDGVTLATNDRVLVKEQSSISENGVYIVGASPARATDLNANGDVSSGMFFFVEEGTLNDNTGWVCKTPDTGGAAPTLANMEFVQFSGTGLITAGAGLTKTSNTLDVNYSELLTLVGTGNSKFVPSAGSSGQFLAYNGVFATPPNTTYTADDGISLSGTAFSVAAGTGLTQDSSGLSLNLQGVAEVAVNEEDDYFIILDGGATGAAKKEKLADFVSAIAGGNIDASSGRLNTANTVLLTTSTIDGGTF